MKNKVFSLFVTLVMLLSISSCGLLRKVCKNGESDIVAGSVQNMYQTNAEYTFWQVDSMCIADNLPANFDGWISKTYFDYETGENITKYMYIKELGDNYEMIYLATLRGEMYVVSKRKVITEEE